MNTASPHSAAPLLLTQGDAVGIGPEIIAKAFLMGQAAGVLVLGDVGVMRRAVAAVGGGCVVARVEGPEDVAGLPARCLPVWTPPGLPAGLAELPWGQVSALAGAGAARCIEAAVALLQAGRGCAMVTAPVHKEALAAAGVPFPGHTEMLQHGAASLAGGVPPPVRMMLANEELRIVLVSIHLSLKAAIEAVTFDNVLQTIRMTHKALAPVLGRAPRIAVAGLNPHAGELGLFGREEIDTINPAIAVANAEGIRVSGSFAPDTVFMRARNSNDHPGEFDAVVAMYHDQGLIPVKYLGMEHGVNVTLGLPVVRTSPDHGTAFEIAGTGQADATSLVAAIRMAKQLS